MNLTIPVNRGVKIKESNTIDQFLDFNREQKKTIQYEDDGLVRFFFFYSFMAY